LTREPPGVIGADGLDADLLLIVLAVPHRGHRCRMTAVQRRAVPDESATAEAAVRLTEVGDHEPLVGSRTVQPPVEPRRLPGPWAPGVVAQPVSGDGGADVADLHGPGDGGQLLVVIGRERGAVALSVERTGVRRRDRGVLQFDPARGGRTPA